MGNCYEKIMFMAIDNTPVVVESATHVKDFEMKTLWDFANKRGGFSVDTNDDKHYIFNCTNGDFIEFHTK